MKNLIKSSSAKLSKILCFLPIFCIFLALNTKISDAQTRIKDIVDFEGVRENMLIGYGLVAVSYTHLRAHET